MNNRAIAAGAIAVVAAVGAWILFVGLPSWYGPKPAAPTATPAAAPSPVPERRITATLYFVSEDGMSLVGVQREIPFGDPIVEQARRIVEAQIAAAPPGLASPIPSGTTLRGLYLSDRGDAFVDLNSSARTNHTGGALDELFTVYAIVDALTVNLPAITRVQILIEGREVDTLAGHVDLRHPLQKNLKWVRTEKEKT
ncbi:MAG: GerMN domain-containing protein [Acidobacteria bacterium]|nr:GerMN domain-containing protein [Acidobacteriota bacterium]MCA1648717.1 GerMN domain-containing protein [Acidobacteriota bacterium]